MNPWFGRPEVVVACLMERMVNVCPSFRQTRYSWTVMESLLAEPAVEAVQRPSVKDGQWLCGYYSMGL